MNTPDQNADLLDLGAASVETQGIPADQTDLGAVGIPAGLSADD